MKTPELLSKLRHWSEISTSKGKVLAEAADIIEQGLSSPCLACGYGGKHLDAPPCNTCPAYPKKENKEDPHE